MSAARARIKRFVQRELLAGRAVRDEQSLWDAGVDSLGLIKLVRFVESSFAIEIPPRDVRPKVFESIAAIADYVERRRRRAA